MVALVRGNTRSHDGRGDVYVEPKLSAGNNQAVSSSAPELECQPIGTANAVKVLTASLPSPAAPCSPAKSREMCQGDSSTRTVRAASQMKQPDGTGTGAAAEKPPRGLKRALKGALGISLVAAAAALLAGADDVGEWLHSVAPNVLPHAEAGAEIVQRAIAEAKKCIHEGANVCLDAEGQVTALYAFVSQWYLSPRQHVIETAGSILLLSPLVYVYFKLCRARLHLRRATGTFNLTKTPFVMKLWGAGLVGHVAAGAFLKFTMNELISHPAYLWQPCHVHSLVMGLCVLSESELSLLVMHVSTTLWWGPFLAFVAPSLPNDPLEIAIFWGQHTLMLMVPFLRLLLGGQWMYRDFWWNSVGFLFLTCYHWWWLAPVNIVTGVNVATMSVPPASLEMFGKYYRLVWALSCMGLQAVAVVVMGLLARLVGQWPSRPSPPLVRTAEKTANGNSSKAAAKARGGRVPADAIGISRKEAVSLVDGN